MRIVGVERGIEADSGRCKKQHTTQKWTTMDVPKNPPLLPARPVHRQSTRSSPPPAPAPRQPPRCTHGCRPRHKREGCGGSQWLSRDEAQCSALRSAACPPQSALAPSVRPGCGARTQYRTQDARHLRLPCRLTRGIIWARSKQHNANALRLAVGRRRPDTLLNPAIRSG